MRYFINFKPATQEEVHEAIDKYENILFESSKNVLILNIRELREKELEEERKKREGRILMENY